MLKFAANLSLLWAELPYLDRFAAAADAGFEAVEILFPYDLAASRTQRALIANGLELILMNGPPPNSKTDFTSIWVSAFRPWCPTMYRRTMTSPCNPRMACLAWGRSQQMTRSTRI